MAAVMLQAQQQIHFWRSGSRSCRISARNQIALEAPVGADMSAVMLQTHEQIRSLENRHEKLYHQCKKPKLHCRHLHADIGAIMLQTQKQIRILENRLEKMYHKFNESKSHNRDLRTDIDNLRRERLVFDDIHRKLAKSLLVKRKEMAAVIAHTNHILESRDKVGSACQTLTKVLCKKIFYKYVYTGKLSR